MPDLYDEFMAEESLPVGDLYDEFMGIKPSPARKEMEKAEPEEERLKTLELAGLPITTPRTPKEVLGPVLTIPRGLMEGALAMGSGFANFMSGAMGWRMISELLAGRPLERAIEEGSKGLWSYEPETAAGQKAAFYMSKPFEMVRKGVEWAVPRIIRNQVPVPRDWWDEIEKSSNVLPAIEAAMGTIMELGVYTLFGTALKRAVGKGAKPTPEQVLTAAKEAIKEGKAGKRTVRTIPRPIEEVGVEAEIAPVRSTIEGLPIDRSAEVVTPRVRVEVKGRIPKEKAEKIAAEVAEAAEPEVVTPKVLDKKTRTAIQVLDAQAKDSFEIAEKLGLRESEVTAYLESLVRPKEIVTMKQIEAEARSIVDKAKNLDEAYEGIRELTTRYEENLEAGFKDAFELARYREFGDELLGRVIKARKDKGLPDETLHSFGMQKFYEDITDAGRKLGERMKKSLGITKDPTATMYIDLEGNRIAAPGILQYERKLVTAGVRPKVLRPITEEGVAMAVHWEVDAVNFGTKVKPGEFARRSGWLEIRDSGPGNIAWVRAHSRLTDAQIDFLRELSRTRKRVDYTVHNIEGDIVGDYMHEDFPRFLEHARPPLERGASEYLYSFGTFQRMYDGFVEHMRRAFGKPLSGAAEEMLSRGAIVKQRRVRGLLRPPVYEAEFNVLKNAKVLDETFFRRAFTNPIRVMEEAGGEPLKAMTIHPYQRAEKAFRIMRERTSKDVAKLRGRLSGKEKRQLMYYAVSKQPKGDAMLKYMKVPKEKIPTKLTPKVEAVYQNLRQRYENLYRRLNNVRRAIGMEEFPYQENYFTFFRDMTVLENMGFSPLHVPISMLNAAFVKLRATPFRYAKARTKALYRLEMDPFYIFERYSYSALRHIHLSPLVAKIREYMSEIVDPVTGNKFQMINENPVLAKSLDGWANHIAGKVHPRSLGPRADRLLLRVNSNLTAAILGANVRSAMIQVTALRNTVAEIGLKYTLRGVESLINPAKRNFAMKKGNLSTRKMDVSVEDAIRAIKMKRFGEAKATVARASLKPLQILDLETAKACWQGAYEFGIEQLKLSTKKAATFANDVVTRTQASALPGDIAPIQRHVPGKLLTLFQTFTINDWNFLIRDVLGKRNASITTPMAFRKTMRYVAATTMFNIIFEDILKVNSPFPTPIRAFRESLDRGDNLPSMAVTVGKEFIEPIPIVGAARYGLAPTGPVGELLSESVKWAVKKPMHRPWWDIWGRWLGIPGTAQLSKSHRAAKRGETIYGRVVGTYTPPPPRRRTRKRRPTRGR